MNISAKLRTQKPQVQVRKGGDERLRLAKEFQELHQKRKNLLEAHKKAEAAVKRLPLLNELHNLESELVHNKHALEANRVAMRQLSTNANAEPNDFNSISPPQVGARKQKPGPKPKARPEETRGRPPMPGKLSPEQRLEIQKLAGEGVPQVELARRFNVTAMTISNWLKKSKTDG
jgi:hypothetical protein